MKNLIIACLLIISVLTAGCGSSGGSSKPTTIVTAPTISNITTESASTYTVATITGIGFGSPISSSYVTYDGQPYNATTWNDSTILVTVPFAVVDALKFRVVVNSVTSNAPIIVTNTMRIFGITPSSGNPATVITISGQGFGASQVSGAYVTFYDLTQQSNYLTAAVSNWSDTSITCTVPNLSLSQSSSNQVGITVWKSSSTYVSSTFNLILPAISYIDPNTDNVAATISLNGSGFGTTQGTGYVSIGGNYASIVSWSDNQIRVKVPDFSSAGEKNVILTVSNKTYSNNNFSVAAPQYQSLTYPSGDTEVAYGETFIIYGRYFGSATDFDDSNAIRNIQIQADGKLYTVNSATWSDNQVSFAWPVPNTTLDDKTAAVTINVGGLSTIISNVQAD
ncbi:MAG: IPT/TIG domain-containing protein [Candidatus Riflebacteria bacterium]|nr:IPT/TIG domain-containing protein [Candidatus Riflebacteria bacterium]